MSNMVTRCPKCGTAFRITSTQLQSAKGAVRCGSCLHIFKAQDHLVSGTAPGTESALTRKVPQAPVSSGKTPVAAPAKAPAPAKMPEKATEKATEKTLEKTPPQTPAAHKPQIAAATKPASAPTTPVPAQAASRPGLSKPAQPAGAKATKPQTAPAVSQPVTAKAPRTQPPVKDTLAFNQQLLDKEIAASDEDDLLISDDMDKPAGAEKGAYDFDGFLDLDTLPKPSVSLFERNKRQRDIEDKDDEESDTDESWAQSLLEDADDDNKVAAIKHSISHTEEAPHSAETDSNTETQTSHGLMFSFVGEVPTTAPEESDLREIFTEEELSAEMRTQDSHDGLSGPAISAYDSSRAALLMGIMPEPVEMTASQNPGWRRKKLWPILALVMLVLLILQLAWLQFDHLSRIQPYRAAYEVICPLVGCQVPVLSDRSKIRVRNLVVTKHRDVEDALKVDLILINTASFDQPFPDLHMAFSSLEGEALASRRFTPRDYLAGELAGRQLMPHNRPIHISLELVDPGEEAVNYKIEPL